MGNNIGLKIIRLKTNAQNLEMWMAYEENGEEERESIENFGKQDGNT